MIIELIVIAVLIIITLIVSGVINKHSVVASDYILCDDKCRECVNDLIVYLKTRKSKLSNDSKTETLHMWCDIIMTSKYKVAKAKVDDSDTHTISEHRKIVIEALKQSFVYDEKIQDYILVPEQLEIANAHIVYLIIL